ncbi:MAG: hypothetical protein ACR2M1_10265 [Gemmatimonadaceae bacterium]
MTPSWPYLHTLINHFPIVLTVVGTLAVLLALVYPRRGLWLYALGTLILAGITIYPAWLSGDKAADAVHNAWYVPAGSIRQHAQAADITLWLLIALGIAALVAWASIVRAREAFAPARWIRSLVAILAVVALGAVAYTGYRGGQIVVDSSILASPTPPVAPAAPVTSTPLAPPTTPALGQPMQTPMAPVQSVPVQPAPEQQPIQQQPMQQQAPRPAPQTVPVMPSTPSGQ